MAGLELREIAENASLQGELEERITTYLAWNAKFETRQLPAYVRSYWYEKRSRRVP
jgi:hypothetical protein